MPPGNKTLTHDTHTIFRVFRNFILFEWFLLGWQNKVCRNVRMCHLLCKHMYHTTCMSYFWERNVRKSSILCKWVSQESCMNVWWLINIQLLELSLGTLCQRRKTVLTDLTVCVFSSKIQTRDPKRASGARVIIRTWLVYRTLWRYLLNENAEEDYSKSNTSSFLIVTHVLDH